MSVSGRSSQALFQLEVADQALIHFSIFFKNPCLRMLAEYPADGHGYGVCSVRHAVGAVAIFGLHNVAILALLKTQIGMRLQRRVCTGISSAWCMAAWEYEEVTPAWQLMQTGGFAAGREGAARTGWHE